MTSKRDSAFIMVGDSTTKIPTVPGCHIGEKYEGADDDGNDLYCKLQTIFF